MSSEYKKENTIEIWVSFEPIDDFYAKCIICEDKVSYKTTTFNLKKRMNKKHPTVVLPVSNNMRIIYKYKLFNRRKL